MVHNEEAYHFVTRIFNQCFNRFINIHLEKKRIGTDFGHSQDIALYDYDNYYFQARDLSDLRDDILKSSVINTLVLKDIIRSIAKIYVASKYDIYLKKDIYKFTYLIKKEYGLDLRHTFEAQIKILGEKSKPISNPTTKPTPKPESKPSKHESLKFELEKSKPILKLAPKSEPEPSKSKPQYERLKQESPETEPKKPKSKSRLSIWIVVIVIILIMFFGLLSYLVLAETRSEVVEKINKTRIVYENVTLTSKISFQEYYDDILYYDKTEITIKGLLRRYVEGDLSAGKYVQAIEDDDGKRFVLSNRQTEYQAFFPKNGISTSVYEITGVLIKRYNGINIEVSNVILSQRNPVGVKQVEKNEMYTEENKREVISPKFPMIRAFILNLLGQPVTCSDGTLVNKCSLIKPLYCGYSGLKNNPADCGCPDGQRLYKKECIPVVKCSDNTLSPECSVNKPKQCADGKLVDNADLCGCLKDYRKVGNSCKKIMRCSDGTEYGQCTNNKPFYCEDGEIVPKSSICGCPFGDVSENDLCLSQYQTGAKTTILFYDGGKIEFEVYRGLNDYLKGLDRAIYTYGSSSSVSDIDFVLRNLNNVEQKKQLSLLSDRIKQLSEDSDNQAKIAIRIVQNIPYDWEGFTNGDISGKYPYEVLFTNAGVCSEKVGLLAYLLRDLGYGVAVLRFSEENHDAIGIKCPSNYNYKDTGYCFVEATTPSMIGDSYGNYVGVGQLKSNPNVLVVSEGTSLKSI